MAADDEDDMEWLDYEEQMQHPKSDEDEGDAEYEFPELEMGFEFRKSERAGFPTSRATIASPRHGASSVTHQDATQTVLSGRPCQ